MQFHHIIIENCHLNYIQCVIYQFLCHIGSHSRQTIKERDVEKVGEKLKRGKGEIGRRKKKHCRFNLFSMIMIFIFYVNVSEASDKRSAHIWTSCPNIKQPFAPHHQPVYPWFRRFFVVRLFDCLPPYSHASETTLNNSWWWPMLLRNEWMVAYMITAWKLQFIKM